MDKMYLKEKDFQDYETYEISEKLMKAFWYEYTRLCH